MILALLGRLDILFLCWKVAYEICPDSRPPRRLQRGGVDNKFHGDRANTGVWITGERAALSSVVGQSVEEWASSSMGRRRLAHMRCQRARRTRYLRPRRRNNWAFSSNRHRPRITHQGSGEQFDIEVLCTIEYRFGHAARRASCHCFGCLCKDQVSSAGQGQGSLCVAAVSQVARLCGAA